MAKKIPFEMGGKIYMVDAIGERRIPGVKGVARTGLIYPEFKTPEEREKARQHIKDTAERILQNKFM